MESETGTAGRLRYRKGSVSVPGKLQGDPDSVSATEESESSGSSEFSTSNVKSLMKNVFLRSQYKAWIRIILFVIPSSVDPLAFYIPVINNDKKCLNLHKPLLSTAFLFSLACKIFVVIISLFFMIVHLMFTRGNWRRYKLRSFLVDFLISIPVSEMVLPHLMINMTGSELWDAINFFELIVIIIQYVARIIRIYSSFSRAIVRSRKLVEATWPRVAFNLFLYLQAANVFGGLWYFMAIKREIECWNKACINHTGKSHCSFNCNDNLEDYTFVSELCPTKKRNTTIHDFGIFHAALESGIVEDTNILQKFLHCFVWGLQNLSNLGHNLQTSSDLRENIFVILVVSSGLMLFALMIGNLQTYLLSRTVRLKEMTKKPREIEEWEPFQKISKDLQQQVKKYKSYIWRKTNHIDVESLLNNLPKELRMEIKRELCWPLLKKVLECMMLNEETLDALCDRVKPTFFTDHTYIVREGDPIDEMIFVLQGKLLTYNFKDITSGATSSDNKRDDSHTTMKNDHLQDGDFYGEELIDWALRDRFSLDIPKSNRTIQALTNVEAFILMVDDLKIVHIDMMNQAARLIQLAWRRHQTRRLREWEQKDLINELTQGRELAEMLQAQLNTPPFVSLHDLAREIFIPKIISSYEKALYMLNFSRSSSSTRDLQPAGLIIESPTSLSINSWSDQESEGSVMDPAELKDRSKKIKTLPRWTQNVRVTPTPWTGLEESFDDGYSWRKYGQKDILGAKYPRGYYRCTHRHDKGCLATKQVQRSDEDPTIFEITYRGYHTCTQETNTTIQQHNFYQKQQQREQALLNLKKGLKIVTQDSVVNPPEQSPFVLELDTARFHSAARVIQSAWRGHHTRRLREWEQKNTINDLTEGRELAKQLQVQLNTPSFSSSHDQAREMLVKKILSSYEKALSVLNLSSSSSSTRDPQLTRLMIKSPTSLGMSSWSNQDYEGRFIDPLELKYGSKKRKTWPTWTRNVRVTPAPGAGLEGLFDDGYSWRKYGQKDILGAKYPRSYYRCALKFDKGCSATKQVQRSDKDPTIYEITYWGYHTCTEETNITNEPQQQQREQALLNLKKGLKIVTGFSH